MPCTPWQVAQSFAFSSIGSAASAPVLKRISAASNAGWERAERGKHMAATFHRAIRRAVAKRTGHCCPVLLRSYRRLISKTTERSINRKSDDVVPALEVDLGITARTDHDVLL